MPNSLWIVIGIREIFRTISRVSRKVGLDKVDDQRPFDPFGWKARKKTTFDKVVYTIFILFAMSVLAFLAVATIRSFGS